MNKILAAFDLTFKTDLEEFSVPFSGAARSCYSLNKLSTSKSKWTYVNHPCYELHGVLNEKEQIEVEFRSNLKRSKHQILYPRAIDSIDWESVD